MPTFSKYQFGNIVPETSTYLRYIKWNKSNSFWYFTFQQYSIDNRRCNRPLRLTSAAEVAELLPHAFVLLWLQFVSKPSSCSITRSFVRIQRAQQRGRWRQRRGRQHGAAWYRRLARAARVRDQAVERTTLHRWDGERRHVCQAQSAAVGSGPEVFYPLL